MRGQGIELKERYKWCVQPNGKLTVFDVPIFSVFSDEEKGSLNQRDLREIIQNFARDRTEGFYPRIHEKHQEADGVENATGIGFLDNLYERGGVIFADLTEIEEGFRKSLNAGAGPCRLPGRSVEFNPVRKSIDGLAMLESRPPFFRFPVLALEKEPIKLDMAHRQFCDNRAKTLQKGENMWFTTKRKKCPDKTCTFQEEGRDAQGPPETTEGKPERYCKYQAGEEEGEGGGIQQQLGEMIGLLKQLLSAEEEEGMGEEGMGEEGMPEEEEVGMEEPSSVAMQSSAVRAIDKQLKSMQIFQEREAKFLRERVAKLEGGQATTRFQGELEAICETAPNLNFKALSTTLEGFSSTKDKENFLTFVEMQADTYSQHQITDQVKQFGCRASKDKVMRQFQDKPAGIQKVANQARRDYLDTINQRNRGKAVNFQAQNPSIETYVLEAVKWEEDSPGFYNAHYRKGAR